MNFHKLVNDLIIDSKGSLDGGWFSADSSIGLFLPEIILCITMVLMLLIRVPASGRHVPMWIVALIGTLAAFVVDAPWQLLNDAAAIPNKEIFTGMLVFDGFTVFMRAVLIGFGVLFIIMTKLSGIPDNEDGPDIYTLVLGSIVGMCLMVSANHLLMIFMAIEMASVPSYVLAGLLKGRRVSSEAALKYSIYGAGAAGVMLYGISLLAGLVNSAHLPTMATILAAQYGELNNGELMVLAMGGLMLAVGLAFKLSAVPFHFWCPDVFEGASAEVAAFLSVASKAAALGLLVRVAIGFGVAPAIEEQTAQLDQQVSAVVAVDEALAGVGVFNVPDTPVDETPANNEDAADETASGPATADADIPSPSHKTTDEETAGDQAHDVAAIASANDGLAAVRNFIAQLIALLAIVTCTFGNLAAYGQTNIKRLLAYSTIAHAGYMMMAVPPIMALVSVGDRLGAEDAVRSLAVYIAIYVFMNLGAFAVVAFLRNAMRSEEIADYGGLIKRSPLLVICFSLMLFSLVGLPPLAGFIGKFAIFASITQAYQATDHFYLILLLVVGGLNTAISLFYYLRVVKVMTMDPEPEDRQPFEYSTLSMSGIFVCLLTVPTVVLMVVGGSTLVEMATAAARSLL